MALENDLIDLNDIGEPPRHADLVQLSGLSNHEVAGFKSSWASLSEDRKCEILTRLAELSEDNMELDFTAVLRACLTDGNETVREQARHPNGRWGVDPERAEKDRLVGALMQLLPTYSCPALAVLYDGLSRPFDGYDPDPPSLCLPKLRLVSTPQRRGVS